MEKLVAGITFNELVQYVELKMKMEMTLGGNMDEYSAYDKRRNIIKIGDVLTDEYNEGDYYVVVDVQIEKNGQYRGFGLNIGVRDGEPTILDGATHFRGDGYINRKTGMNVLQFNKKIINQKVMEQINEYEAKISELQKQLV
jgi:hypothetical protein